MIDFNSIPRKDRTIIALDCEVDKALAIAYELAGVASWVKIGMTLYYAYGHDLIRMLKTRGYKVFLDLKFYDIPHQVEGAACSAASSGADMLTMHASGGVEMMRHALIGATRGAEEIGKVAPVTLGVTVLTSMDDATLKQVGVCNSMQDQVLTLASLTREAGISGVVASPMEAAMLRETLGSEAFIVCPGVRPAGSDKQDQSRVATPKEAFDRGASHIVIGRPVTGADDPVRAFKDIAASLD